MTHWRDARDKRQIVVRIPTVWLAALLSLLVHVTMLWFWLPRIPQPHLDFDADKPGTARPALVTMLAPRSEAKPATPPAPPPAPAAQVVPPLPTVKRAPPRAPPPRPTPPPPPVATLPPVITPGARAPAPPPPTTTPPPVPQPPAPPAPPAPAAPAPTPAPPATDLASYIEARRRARGEVSPSSANGSTPNSPAESEIERRNRIVAANLAQPSRTFGYDPKSSGGVFQIKRIGYDDAEFYFTGFDKDISRRAKQLIEVRKGANNDIRTAMVKKMIEIIRSEVQGDFTWLSDRATRSVTLSARPADNDALEAFLMNEFFPDGRRSEPPTDRPTR